MKMQLVVRCISCFKLQYKTVNETLCTLKLRSKVNAGSIMISIFDDIPYAYVRNRYPIVFMLLMSKRATIGKTRNGNKEIASI